MEWHDYDWPAKCAELTKKLDGHWDPQMLWTSPIVYIESAIGLVSGTIPAEVILAHGRELCKLPPIVARVYEDEEN